jgi:formylglycine-generating enzyme required for sulfatase activity
MSGNVWQWVNDWYGTNYYAVSPYRNPPGPDAGSPTTNRIATCGAGVGTTAA